MGPGQETDRQEGEEHEKEEERKGQRERKFFINRVFLFYVSNALIEERDHRKNFCLTFRMLYVLGLLWTLEPNNEVLQEVPLFNFQFKVLSV